MDKRSFEALNTHAKVLYDQPMSEHTSFKIGGPADVLIVPDSAAAIVEAVTLVRGMGIEPLIIGNGSNLLVGDKGIRGVVIKTRGADAAVISGDSLSAECGALLSRIAVLASNEGLAGLAFAHGIPGSVGGAVTMNAGAYGSEMKNVVESTEYLDVDGSVRRLDGEQHCFEYRRSWFAAHPQCVVLRSVFRLERGDTAQIESQMADLASRRREKQPLEYPSAGSTFKRPPGHFAGQLIEQCGLKGMSIGGAMISDKHAGFIINKGGASASDVLSLIEHVQREVLRQSGVQLECEIKTAGEF